MKLWCRSFYGRHASPGLESHMYLDEVRTILTNVLNLGDAGERLHANSPLLGSIPELDSMAVVSLLAALEEHFGITVNDDDISAEFVAQHRPE
jgi:acyl carrier protein